MRRIGPVLLALLGGIAACTHPLERGSVSDAAAKESEDRPPVAALRPHPVTSPQGARIDPWYWLRDDTRANPDVIAYLEAENTWFERARSRWRALEDALYDEIVGRIKQDDESVPLLDHDYWYQSRYRAGDEYPLYLRRADRDGAPEEVLLDVERMAQSYDYFQIGAAEVSPDNRLLAYAEDTVGRRQYVLRVRNLETGVLLPDEITNAEPEIAWANDNRSFFYIEKHPETLLGYRVRRHVLGALQQADALAYEEVDETFTLDVRRSKDDRFILISSDSTTTSEWRFVDASSPGANFEIVLPRVRDHEYDVEPLGERFIVRTNRDAPNFRIVELPLEGARDASTWREIVPHDQATFIHDFEVFARHLAVAERAGGLRRLRIHPWEGDGDYEITSDEPAYTALLDSNPQIDTTKLRYTYTSLTTPRSTYEYDMATGAEQLLKRDPVLGDFDPARYTTEFVWIEARDGTRVPVSLVRRTDTAVDGTAPLYVYAYGSYGISTEPAFSSTRLSLLDRGFVYAIAHVRGGQELGRAWYDAGRMLLKRNTFTDFIDVTRSLVQRGYGHPRKVFAMGGSAGGLLVGAIVNIAPELYRGIVAHVPFVDVVTTMLDDSIPLTTLEYDEWGDPRERRYYDYMLSYSPYDNVRAQAYPAMLITTGLWDSQVQYWEPAKWVAKLRATAIGSEPLYLRTTMEAGHGGKSGRFEKYREVAEEYAFVLTLLAGE
jgi:oligopeptidase B